MGGGKRQAKYISLSLKLAAALVVVLHQPTLCFEGQLLSVVGSFWDPWALGCKMQCVLQLPQAAVPSPSLDIQRSGYLETLEGLQAGKPPASVSSLVGEL